MVPNPPQIFDIQRGPTGPEFTEAFGRRFTPTWEVEQPGRSVTFWVQIGNCSLEVPVFLKTLSHEMSDPGFTWNFEGVLHRGPLTEHFSLGPGYRFIRGFYNTKTSLGSFRRIVGFYGFEIETGEHP